MANAALILTLFVVVFSVTLASGAVVGVKRTGSDVSRKVEAAEGGNKDVTIQAQLWITNPGRNAQWAQGSHVWVQWGIYNVAANGECHVKAYRLESGGSGDNGSGNENGSREGPHIVFPVVPCSHLAVSTQLDVGPGKYSLEVRAKHPNGVPIGVSPWFDIYVV